MRALGRPSTTVPLILSLILVPLTVVLAFVWTGEDVDQGFSQKIFYLHVPIAFTSYVAFAYGAFCAAMYLWRRTPSGTCAPTWASTPARSSARWCS